MEVACLGSRSRTQTEPQQPPTAQTTSAPHLLPRSRGAASPDSRLPGPCVRGTGAVSGPAKHAPRRSALGARRPTPDARSLARTHAASAKDAAGSRDVFRSRSSPAPHIMHRASPVAGARPGPSTEIPVGAPRDSHTWPPAQHTATATLLPCARADAVAVAIAIARATVMGTRVERILALAHDAEAAYAAYCAAAPPLLPLSASARRPSLPSLPSPPGPHAGWFRLIQDLYLVAADPMLADFDAPSARYAAAAAASAAATALSRP